MKKDLLAAEADLSRGLALLRNFAGANLGRTLGEIEQSMRGVTYAKCGAAVAANGVETELLKVAGSVKRLAAQINVIVHGVGILLCLPHILDQDEVIEYVSLGAGNTGKAFDLETDRRIAEFKFISWKGGSEAIRQNNLLKDFYLMAEHPTPKAKFLYVLDTKHPMKFFQGGRSIKSVLSQRVKLHEEFREALAPRFERVRDYYESRKSRVTIVDVSPFIPELLEAAIATEDPVD